MSEPTQAFEAQALEPHLWAQAIYETLKGAFGEPVFEPGQDPLETVLGTILSANTTDVNSGRAFERLKALCGGEWDLLRLTPLDAVIDAIRPAGMYNQKAPHMIATLEALAQRPGGYDLRDLAAMPVAEAMALLTSLPGVGHKTASIVLLFCFNRPAFPVDTHIQRITQRVGLASAGASPAAVKAVWEALLPGELFYPLHLNLIRLGREFCLARAPRCAICPIQPLCNYGRA